MKTLIARYSRLTQFCIITGVSLLLFSCQSKDKAADDDAKVVSQTPVTVTTVDSSALTDYRPECNFNHVAKKHCKVKCHRLYSAGKRTAWT